MVLGFVPKYPGPGKNHRDYTKNHSCRLFDLPIWIHKPAKPGEHNYLPVLVLRPREVLYFSLTGECRRWLWNGYEDAIGEGIRDSRQVFCSACAFRVVILSSMHRCNYISKYIITFRWKNARGEQRKVIKKSCYWLRLKCDVTMSLRCRWMGAYMLSQCSDLIRSEYSFISFSAKKCSFFCFCSQSASKSKLLFDTANDKSARLFICW